MAVSTSRAVSTDGVGLYVPYRGFDREAGIVGTLAVDAEVTGDGSGGAVTILITMARQEFGFHPIYVPTRVSSFDSLATPEVVMFQFDPAGNERISDSLRESSLAQAGFGGSSATFDKLGVPIEPDQEASTSVLVCQWTTNENGDTYHLHVFGVVYDAEALARAKRPGATPDQLLGGVR